MTQAQTGASPMSVQSFPAGHAGQRLLDPAPVNRQALRKPVCGKLDRPGIALANCFEIDYSRRQTSVDQARIEAWLGRTDLAGKTLLHVGVGNSSLAKGLAHRVVRVDGLTAHPNEKAHADSLRIPNYRVVLLNKHSRELFRLRGAYDFIIDNNLASFACC